MMLNRKSMALAALLVAGLLGGCGSGSSSGSAAITPSSVAPQTTPDTPHTPELPDVTTVTDSGETNFDEAALTEALDALPVEELSDAEREGLLLMREEEKLAGDVYRYLFAQHNLQIFSNISRSEDTHTAAVKKLLDRYELPDPAEGNGEGVFSNMDLQMLYDSLTARGTPSILDALYVGVLIEELDIFDLDRLIGEVEDNEDIVLVYESLQKGSRNHLRSFYRQVLDRGGSYTPEYLTQESFDDIVNSDIERGP